jgi:uncharacterized cupredoxin-like copper-binding protein
LIRPALIALLGLALTACVDPSNDKVAKDTIDCVTSDAHQDNLALGCPNDVEIVATDYAFQPPAYVHAGRATFRFVNKGKVRHELNISLLKPGVSMDEFLDSVRADKPVQALTQGPVGVLFAAPGKKSGAGLSINLVPGERYAIVCIFKDSTNAKHHYDLGMYKLVTVTKARPVAGLAQVATDTIVATDYAFQYPRTVMPGRHTFVMRNDGKMRHELDFALLRKGVTPQHLLEVEKTGASVDSLFDSADFGLLHARSGVIPYGEMTIDMLPGRDYAIACFFQDTPKAPEHYKLGMYGFIQVSPKPIT